MPQQRGARPRVRARYLPHRQVADTDRELDVPHELVEAPVAQDLVEVVPQRLPRLAGKPVGVHSPGYVADTDEQAREELWPDYRVMRDRIGAERGWPPMNRAEFDHEVEHGSLYVGSPETVAQKIAATAKGLGISRFDLKYSAGPLAHERMMESIRLYGEKVIPLVREMLA